MKKIVYIVESFGGGVFSYFVDLTSGLVDNYEIYVLYSLRTQTPKNFEKYFDKRIKFIRIINFERSLNLIKDVKAYFEVKNLLLKIQPDIVHLHSSKAGGLGRLIKYQNGEKVFYTPHGYSFLYENGKGVKKTLFLLIEKILGKKDVTTIACSEGEYKASKKVTNKSICINNSINTKYLSKFYNDISSNRDNVFFTIGRINEQKNPALFNQIASSLPSKKFVWIGDGPMRDELKSKNITVTGWLPREQVLKKIQPYKYFILSSKWEGLPISLLEAMYFGKVCFVTDIIGNNDVVSDEVNGYLFNNCKEFVKKEKNKKNLSEEASMTIKRKFSKEQMIEKYINAYSK